MRALYLFARLSDVVWWMLIFAVAYDAYNNPASRVVLGLLLWRWMNRGIYNVYFKLKAEHEGRSAEYGPR